MHDHADTVSADRDADHAEHTEPITLADLEAMDLHAFTRDQRLVVSGDLDRIATVQDRVAASKEALILEVLNRDHPLPCTECGRPSVRNGTRLCPTCWAAWQAAPRPPRGDEGPLRLRGG